jgi:phospholipase C
MARLASLLLLAILLAATPVTAQVPTFRHIVIIVQENRTPDNLFGSNPTFEPGVDLAVSGEDSTGAIIPLTGVPLAGCYDLSHSHASFVVMYHHGKMNGADHVVASTDLHCPIPPYPQFKYVDNGAGAVQPYFDIARAYGFANRMFQTNQGPSFPAHQFIFGATSAPTSQSRFFAAENMVDSNSVAGCVAPIGQRVALIGAAGQEDAAPPVYPCFVHDTMGDLLDRSGISWKYYNNTTQTSSIWNAPAAMAEICVPEIQTGARVCAGSSYAAHVTSVQAQVLTDIAACKLPAVSWVIPDAYDSDHAEVNAGTGPAWVASIVNAIGTQPSCAGGDNYWQDTAIFITWDDWGGWYDHVPPYHVGGWPDEDWGAGYIYGFRVPLLVVSAYTAAGHVDNANLDFGSLLNFTEKNFGLRRIGPGFWADAHGGSLDGFFGLSSPRPFTAIPSPLPAAYFLHAPRSRVGPDDDDD